MKKETLIESLYVLSYSILFSSFMALISESNFLAVFLVILIVSIICFKFIFNRMISFGISEYKFFLLSNSLPSGIIFILFSAFIALFFYLTYLMDYVDWANNVNISDNIGYFILLSPFIFGLIGTILNWLFLVIKHNDIKKKFTYSLLTNLFLYGSLILLYFLGGILSILRMGS